MSNVRVRFAPSPTGLLHIGGARTALFNWLFARSQGGTFVLRVEDTDEARNTPEANQAIFDGLHWLGLDWDEGPEKGGECGPYRQSERTAIYDAYLAKLESAGLVYEDEGAVRFKAPNTDITIDDLVCGPTTFANREEPDMTIKRPDGGYIFHFVSVVDDIEMGITHVIRGEDHLSNTPRHLDLYAAFGATPPKFAHIPLILNQDGSKMSKRDQGAAIGEYRELGFHPDAVVNYLALLGWSPKDDQEVLTRDEIVKLFTLENVNTSNARFDYEKCQWFSGQFIQHLEPAPLREGIARFVESAGISAELSDEVLTELREKLTRYDEAPTWLAPLFLEDYPVSEEAIQKLKNNASASGVLDALTAAFEASESWDHDSINAAVATAAETLGLKAGKLMFPCRVAISGQTGGLGIFTILETIGRDAAVARIRKTTELLAS